VILRLRTTKGVESQFYIQSDIGEGAFVLPLEPAYYWISTNNGDDNQLFQDMVARNNGDFFKALQQVIQIAPGGATMLQELHNHIRTKRDESQKETSSDLVSRAVINAVGNGSR